MIRTSRLNHAGVAAKRSDRMKFFVDTANTVAIRALAASGLPRGMTANPSRGLRPIAGNTTIEGLPTGKGLATFLADGARTRRQIA
jgi:hypothetical protein